MPQSTADLVAHDSTSDGPGNGEGGGRRPTFSRDGQMHDEPRPSGPSAAAHRRLDVTGPPHPVRRWQHRGSLASGGELGATLAPTSGQDRAACAGAHPQAETVNLRATAVVGLERPLAHWSPHSTARSPHQPGVDMRLQAAGAAASNGTVHARQGSNRRCTACPRGAAVVSVRRRHRPPVVVAAYGRSGPQHVHNPVEEWPPRP